jgi:uncharacterized RDD family membrane protein YckC
MENVLPQHGGGITSDGSTGYTSAPPPGAGGPPPDAGVTRLRLAGWWRRVGAAVIDGLVIGVLAGVLLAALIAGLSASLDDAVGRAVGVFLAGLVCAACAFVAAVLYAVWMSARTNGRTVGRMATGIRAARVNGAPMTFKHAFVREAVIKWGLFYGLGGLLTLGLLPLVDVLWPLWDEQNRALHDLLARTRVIRA